jgi:hypothetical protein
MGDSAEGGDGRFVDAWYDSNGGWALWAYESSAGGGEGGPPSPRLAVAAEAGVQVLDCSTGEGLRWLIQGAGEQPPDQLRHVVMDLAGYRVCASGGGDRERLVAARSDGVVLVRLGCPCHLCISVLVIMIMMMITILMIIVTLIITVITTVI